MSLSPGANGDVIAAAHGAGKDLNYQGKESCFLPSRDQRPPVPGETQGKTHRNVGARSCYLEEENTPKRRRPGLSSSSADCTTIHGPPPLPHVPRPHSPPELSTFLVNRDSRRHIRPRMFTTQDDPHHRHSTTPPCPCSTNPRPSPHPPLPSWCTFPI